MNWDIFIAMLIKPFITALILLCVAFLAYLIRRWLPDGRLKRYLFVVRPEAKRRRQFQAALRRREKGFAAQAKGEYWGRRLRRLFPFR